jgi:hypothetical protein
MAVLQQAQPLGSAEMLHVTGRQSCWTPRFIRDPGAGASTPIASNFLYQIWSNFASFVRYNDLKWGEDGEALIQSLVWCNIQLHPTFNLQAHVTQLHEQGITILTSFIAHIFQGWRWSWQKPCVQQLQKYTPLNICYYAQFISIIPCLPPIQLKFLDKAHFVSWHLQCNHIISPTGSTPFLRTTSEISDSFSLTLLTDLSDPDIP